METQQAQPPQQQTPQQQQLAVLKKRKLTVDMALERFKPQLARALPKHFDADRMVRIAMTTLSRDSKLLNCSLRSLMGALIQCAQLGLDPDSVRGHAYLVPFWNTKAGIHEIQLIVGYKGLIELALRVVDCHGRRVVSSIGMEAVYQGDVFYIEKGLHQNLKHVPKGDGEDYERLTHVYAVARMNHGRIADYPFLVLARSDIERIKNSSPGAKSTGSPWNHPVHIIEMAKKSAVRRVCKPLSTATELGLAVALDEAAEEGLEQQFEVDTSAFEGLDVELGEMPSLVERIEKRELGARKPAAPDLRTAGAPARQDDLAAQAPPREEPPSAPSSSATSSRGTSPAAPERTRKPRATKTPEPAKEIKIKTEDGRDLGPDARAAVAREAAAAAQPPLAGLHPPDDPRESIGYPGAEELLPDPDATPPWLGGDEP